MVGIIAVISVGGAVGVIRAADERVEEVDRIDGLAAVLADPDENVEYPAENYLLVGSDSRADFDPDAGDAGFIGTPDQVGGQRSDTIMVLRQEENGGAALMSLPRDLWVPISGTDRSQRINTAYAGGATQLASTVSDSLGIPVHHYVEVDFSGFKNIIDALGGVELCVGYPARDANSGLLIDAGCQTLDGNMALAFARSRYYEQWDGEGWVTDPRGDLGRIERQQFFIASVVNGVLSKLRSSPFSSSDIVDAVVGSVRVDDSLDPIVAGRALRAAAESGLRTYSLPVYNDTVGDAAVLRMADGAEPLLAYFRGDGAAPPEFETTDVTVDGTA